MVDRVDVATNTALVLTNAMVNQETGVRGFVLGGNDAFLDPYHAGVTDARRALASSTRWRATRTPERSVADLAAVRRAIDAWETGYAQPTMERIHRLGAGRVEDAAVAARQGALRRRAHRARRLRGDLQAERADARAGARERGEPLTRVAGVRRPCCCWPRCWPSP